MGARAGHEARMVTSTPSDLGVTACRLDNQRPLDDIAKLADVPRIGVRERARRRRESGHPPVDVTRPNVRRKCSASGMMSCAARGAARYELIRQDDGKIETNSRAGRPREDSDGW